MTKEAMGLRERVRNAIHAAHNDPSLYAWFHEMPEKCRHSQGLADAAIAAMLDAMQEPSEAMVRHGTWEAETCIKDDPCGKAGLHIWRTMLAAFRAEALGEG